MNWGGESAKQLGRLYRPGLAGPSRVADNVPAAIARIMLARDFPTARAASVTE